MHTAYHWVALAVMLAEANYMAERLGLPEKRLITKAQLTHCFIPPVEIMKFGGRIDTGKYSFSFGETERLCFVTKLNPFEDRTLTDASADLSKIKPVIGTNEAYCIASNWLDVIHVDVRKLEGCSSPRVKQQSYLDPDDHRLKKLPIYDVEWWNQNDCTVKVQIDGRNKQLFYLRLEDDSVSGRPRLVKDSEKLLAIPDSEFAGYTRMERSNLVSRFSAVTYDPPTNLDSIMESSPGDSGPANPDTGHSQPARRSKSSVDSQQNTGKRRTGEK
jgi:hypothetical protein